MILREIYFDAEILNGWFHVNSELIKMMTVCKFQDFAISQILSEINFGDFGSAKTAVFALFGALNIANLVNCSLQKVQKYIKIKIQSLQMC